MGLASPVRFHVEERALHGLTRNLGPVVELVDTPAFQAGSCGFESRPDCSWRSRQTGKVASLSR